MWDLNVHPQHGGPQLQVLWFREGHQLPLLTAQNRAGILEQLSTAFGDTVLFLVLTLISCLVTCLSKALPYANVSSLSA